MGRLAARKIAVAALKALRSTPNKENKDEERLKKREIRKQSAREKDYGTAEEKEFCAALLSIQLKIRYMDGDGNCMFRSIADQLTGSCSNHHDIRMMIVAYIEARKDHFSLFMEDDETFEDYIDRIKSPGEWGGHQELYAASQSMRVNIIVHQCSTTAPRFILSCENAVRDINLSYHGECHYNSVHHLINEGDYQDVSKIKASILSAEVTASKQPNLVLETAVKRALPWTTCDHQVQLALKLSNNDVDAAVELLMMNPDGLDDIADSCNVEVVSAHGRLADIENEIINFPNDELGNRPPGHIDDDKPVLRNSKSLKGTRLSARSSDASLPVKLIRRKEILKIKSSAVNVSLSKKEQRKSKKDPNKLDNDSIKSLLGTMTPRVLGAGGVREVFL